MTDKVPTGQWKRALTGGHTAAKVGGKVAAYYAKRPFMSGDRAVRAKEQASRESARALFQGLSLLKGTALKMAQQLSLEIDLLPEPACRELSKAYHQVPPINRALVRKVVHDGLGDTPETLFADFDLTAHAAASLGQVHKAVDQNKKSVAVKIQYPGIAKTIDSDMRLLRRMLSPVIASEHLVPTLTEVAQRLHEEVDYRQEAENLSLFGHSLQLDGVCIPEPVPELTSRTVLTTTFMNGRPLDIWLRTCPSQTARNLVAQKLQTIFLKGLYGLQVIHADPNPGNFLISDDLTINLVDFGCIKRLPGDFVEQYRLLARTAALQEDRAHFQHMKNLGVVSPDLPENVLGEVEAASNSFSRWFGRLYATEVFDFRRNPDFMGQGKEVMSKFQKLRRHLHINTDFIFLDRTRYGLLRLFEQMGAQVSFGNPFEA